KSQTIANIIADQLNGGKKVLFVSEKMAALEVVHDRLRRIGLGPFCLEVHSHRANKRMVVEQLGNALLGNDPLPRLLKDDRFAELREHRTHLNAYVKAL